MKTLYLLSVAICLCTGCARLEIKRVMPGQVSEGVPFYEPRPYLMITSTAKLDAQNKPQPPEFTTQIIWLPDYSKAFVANPVSGWGTADTSVKLVNGWMLDSVGAKMDSKIPETITAISGMVKEAAAAGGAPGVAAAANANDVGIYRIDIDASGNLQFVKQKDWK